MKRINKPNLVVFVFSMLLGIFIAIQFKQNIPYFAPVTLNSIQATKNDINAVYKEIDELKIMLDKKMNKLKC